MEDELEDLGYLTPYCHYEDYNCPYCNDFGICCVDEWRYTEYFVKPICEEVI